ncbi:hypothetical protein [Breznakia pachnodae]|jgi:hypothetical protein|uniref:Uncharacterized protein n=1 Tax=Breznakia pachnodae TaxID=265178 RepID=A0ABU0E5H9_9FIRM|nr:hypothetical protein [Breznakia pachnodae]MDQ0362146.1 hypothetical protein [Breznakia pachnodae]
MQLNSTEQMAFDFNAKAREFFCNRVDNFSIFDVNDDVNHRTFSIDFELYNYFNIRLNYERGRFGCSINNGGNYISLENSQKWFDEADFNIFFKELKIEIELRIPDKYLKAKEWI